MEKALPIAELTDRDRSITMIGILTAMLLAALDQSIVTPAMPTIGGALGDAEYLPWIVTAYLLTATAAAPLYGKISDIYGRRGTLYAALGLFLLGSLMAALAPNHVRPDRRQGGAGDGRRRALRAVADSDRRPAAAARARPVCGMDLGHVGGGRHCRPAARRHASPNMHWSLIFWINLPLGAIALLVINQPLKKLATRPRAHRLDISGAVLLVVATSVLLLVLNWGGISYPWSSPQVLGLLGLSAVFWIAFATRLSRAKEPLVSLEVLSNPIALAGCFGMFMVAAVNVGLSVYLPVYAQAYLGLSPAGSGYALLGFLLGAVAGATLGGRLTLRVVHAKRIAITGAAIGGVALIAAGLLASEKSLVESSWC